MATPLHRRAAEDLIARDLKDADEPLGQNVRDTFPLADVFIDTGDRKRAEDSMDRVFDLIFGNPFHTPTKAEYSMFLAQAAALRSADLGRQVGAALATVDGDLVALGTNEVPKAGGGQYWPGDVPDDRDFQRGYDSNAQHKRDLIAEALRLLRRAGQFDSMTEEDFEQFLYKASMGLKDSPLRGARLGNLIEFGRAMHAEMAAFMDAARRGAPVKGLMLYTTTFPCHECARHIVAAGIGRVVFIEPYPKSLAKYLHADAIGLEQAVPEGRVEFSPFVGIAPRLYMDVFAVSDTIRKKPDGSVQQWVKKESLPREQLWRHPLLVDIQERVEWRRFLNVFLPEAGGTLSTESTDEDKRSIIEEQREEETHEGR